MQRGVPTMFEEKVGRQRSPLSTDSQKMGRLWPTQPTLFRRLCVGTVRWEWGLLLANVHALWCFGFVELTMPLLK